MNYNRIKKVLENAGKTNRWLSKQLGVSETTVSRWAHNLQQPAIHTLYDIGSVLNVEPRELLVLKEELKEVN